MFQIFYLFYLLSYAQHALFLLSLSKPCMIHLFRILFSLHALSQSIRSKLFALCCRLSNLKLFTFSSVSKENVWNTLKILIRKFLICLSTENYCLENIAERFFYDVIALHYVTKYHDNDNSVPFSHCDLKSFEQRALRVEMMLMRAVVVFVTITECYASKGIL